ncbi:hypothetical protein OPQ81_010988 [Rhizoctonia solani]|nr:hypothetical protein OPQ81_010988 [Rhizoctonia solani]
MSIFISNPALDFSASVRTFHHGKTTQRIPESNTFYSAQRPAPRAQQKVSEFNQFARNQKREQPRNESGTRVLRHKKGWHLHDSCFIPPPLLPPVFCSAQNLVVDFTMAKGYTYKSHGTNSKGNHYCSRDYGSSAPNQNSYHYSNTDGSYYYSNPDGSTYYNNGSGYANYTSPNGGGWSSSGGSRQSR